MFGLVGCSLTAARPELQTTPAITEAATASLLPSATHTNTPQATPTALTPTLTLLAPQSTRTPSRPVATLPLVVPEPLLIRSPGAGARVASPLPLRVDYFLGDPAQILRIDLYTEGGLLIFRQIVQLDPQQQKTGSLERTVDFEIRGDTQTGLLIARLEDRPGNPLAVSSAKLVFVSSAEKEGPGIVKEAPYIDIQQPLRNADVLPGELLVRGVTLADPSKTLRVQLVGDDGRLIAQRLARIQPESRFPGGFHNFETTLSLPANLAGAARLLVFLNDGPGAEITHLVSLPLALQP